ncbi:MAG: hypothetical protein ACFFEN_14335 [Candidatus Thorarchaeota archaeon]
MNGEDLNEKSLYKKGLSRFQHGYPKEALKIINELLIQDPKYSEALELKIKIEEKISEDGGDGVKMRYCKRCHAELKPIRDPKTAGKATANVLGEIVGAGLIYTYSLKCPQCGKVLRRRGLMICRVIFITVLLVVAVVMTTWQVL